MIINLNQDVFTLNDGIVTYKSSKQDMIVDSTIEVEYIATSYATKETV